MRLLRSVQIWDQPTGDAAYAWKWKEEELNGVAFGDEVVGTVWAGDRGEGAGNVVVAGIVGDCYGWGSSEEEEKGGGSGNVHLVGYEKTKIDVCVLDLRFREEWKKKWVEYQIQWALISLYWLYSF